MRKESEPDYDEKEAVENILRISEEYDLEDLSMADEKEAIREAAGKIRTFHDVTQQLRKARDQNFESSENPEIYNLALRTGQVWPEAHQARQVMENIVESGKLADKITYSALIDGDESNTYDTAPGIYSSLQSDTLDEAVDVIEDIQEIDQLYLEATAAAESSSEIMYLEDEEPNPIETAKSVAEENGYEEFIQYAEEVQDDFYETEEELTQEVMEIAEEVLE